jgi:hypothetical protein
MTCGDRLVWCPICRVSYYLQNGHCCTINVGERYIYPPNEEKVNSLEDRITQLEERIRILESDRYYRSGQ